MIPHFDFPTVVIRLLLAMLAGGVVGYGRSKKDREAGLRIYMIISIGSAMTVLLSFFEYHMLMGPWKSVTDEVGNKFDVSRLIGQAVTGIGFLGVGIIIKIAHLQVKGLTTATGLFATVSMGVAAGAGYYEAVIVSLILTVIVMNAMGPLERAFKRRLRNITVYVEFNSLEDLSLITDLLRSQQAEIVDIDIERTVREDDEYPNAVLMVKLSRENHSHSGMLSALAELNCVRSVQELIA